MADSDSLEDRVPCSDDMCVGIIGPNGKCGTCGKPGTPPPARFPHPHDDLHERSASPAEPGSGSGSPAGDSAASSETESPAGDSAASSETEPESDPESPAEDSAASPDPADRIPCLDEMCVGILSKKGRCGTCGRQWPRP